MERLSVFPVFHKVSGRTVLLVGEGAEALAKLRLLLATDARVRLVAAAPSAGLSALAANEAVELRRRAFAEADLDGVTLAFAASGEHDADAALVAAARARNIPANAVDLPDLCDFYTPAIVNRAPVCVAIGSAGTGPVLTQKIRARIEALLPERLGVLARLAESFRAAADKMLPKGQVRRRFWSAFFEGDIANAVLDGRPEEARRLAARLLSEIDTERSGLVTIVGTGAGAADHLTLRAQRALLAADLVVHDADVPEAVISLGRRDAERMAASADIDAVLVREAASGRRVVWLAAGDPIASGRADRAIAALRVASLPVETVPGVAEPFAPAHVRAA